MKEVRGARGSSSEDDKEAKTVSLETALSELRSLRNPKNIAGMARFGINTDAAYGIPIPELRRVAKKLGKNHDLAQGLWNSGVHEARILATIVDDPRSVTTAQMDSWANDFDSWDVCDQCCSNLFDKTSMAYDKAVEWSSNDREFVKRAGYTLMAYLAVHDKKMDNAELAKFLPLIVKGSDDERNFVKKSVNWALRQIGKRNLALNRMAIKTAQEIGRLDSKSARWIASDALRELQADAVQKKLRVSK